MREFIENFKEKLNNAKTNSQLFSGAPLLSIDDDFFQLTTPVAMEYPMKIEHVKGSEQCFSRCAARF